MNLSPSSLFTNLEIRAWTQLIVCHYGLHNPIIIAPGYCDLYTALHSAVQPEEEQVSGTRIAGSIPDPPLG